MSYYTNVSAGETSSNDDQQTEPIKSYKDALASVISKRNIEDYVSNSITLTEGNCTYTIRCPVAPKCDDYYVIQRYKTSAIKGIPSLESKIIEVIRSILNRCSSDPKRKIEINSKK
ncbi:uncharacterized protein LOC113557871 [Rhopalosiphum maidis]|uniref:uncharacterized protein LOC113557871 n=1 Tax=Rhopalosiphum maidis TaxID=43146 RepID=UPI000EFDF15E|nr:uncharacterized protein LOC113557871 [Rhopalosiphum maidis]